MKTYKKLVIEIPINNKSQVTNKLLQRKLLDLIAHICIIYFIGLTPE